MDFLLKQLRRYMKPRGEVVIKIRDRSDASRHESFDQANTMIRAFYGSDVVVAFTEKEFNCLLARHEFTYLIVAELHFVEDIVGRGYCRGEEKCVTARAEGSRWHPDKPCQEVVTRNVVVMAESFDRGMRKLLDYAHSHCAERPHEQ